jgi:phage head maturation protease
MIDEIRWSDQHPLACEVRSDGSDGTLLSARFAHWDVWNPVHTAREGRFMEMPVRGSMDETFAENGESVRLLFDHGKDPSIGNRTLGSFRGYENSEAGPVALFDLFRGTSQVDDLMPGIKSGTYGLSYRFGIASAEDEEIDYDPGRSEHNPDGLPERKILRQSVAEVSVTPFPMDKATNKGGALSVRGLESRYGVEDRSGDGPGLGDSVLQAEAVRTDAVGAVTALILNRAIVVAQFE